MLVRTVLSILLAAAVPLSAIAQAPCRDAAAAYERGATLITTNRVYKQWASIFDKNAVLTSALLDRLRHHAETVLIEGKSSYRSKNQVDI